MVSIGMDFSQMSSGVNSDMDGSPVSSLISEWWWLFPEWQQLNNCQSDRHCHMHQRKTVNNLFFS